MVRRGIAWSFLGLFVLVLAGAILLGTMNGQVPLGKEQQAAIQRDLEQLKAAALKFAQAERRLPTSVEALVPRYLEHPPKDPWGRGYVIKSGGPARVYIWCLGSDGALKRYPPDICVIVDAPGL